VPVTRTPEGFYVDERGLLVDPATGLPIIFEVPDLAGGTRRTPLTPAEFAYWWNAAPGRFRQVGVLGPQGPFDPYTQGGVVNTIQRDLVNALIDYLRAYMSEQSAWREAMTAFMQGNVELARGYLNNAMRLQAQRQQYEGQLVTSYAQYVNALGGIALAVEPYRAQTERLAQLSQILSSPLVGWYTARGHVPPQALSHLLNQLLQPPPQPQPLPMPSVPPVQIEPVPPLQVPRGGGGGGAPAQIGRAHV